jgi:hypothetical protein
MLAKCFNPLCSVSLRHLREGRLFRLEADSTRASPTQFGSRGAPIGTEYFWLCGRCSKAMRLRLSHDGQIVTDVLPADAQHNEDEDVAIISRHQGKLLRSVSLIRRQNRFSP